MQMTPARGLEADADGFIVRDARVGVRLTTERDLALVTELENRPEQKAFVLQWTIAQHRAFIDDADGCHLLLVGLSDREPVGYAMLSGLQSANNAIELKRIVLSRQGHGYGH